MARPRGLVILPQGRFPNAESAPSLAPLSLLFFQGASFNSRLQSPSAVILEPKNKVCHCFHPGAPRAQPRRCAPVWPRYRSHRGGNDPAARRVPAQVGADCEPGGTPPRLCLRCEEQPANASIHRKPLSAGCSPLYPTPRPKRPANNPRRGAQALRLAVLALGSGLLRLPPSERSLGSPWVVPSLHEK